MKILKSLLLMAVVLMLLSCSQTQKSDNQFIISGSIRGVADNSKLMFYYENGFPAGFCKVKDGKFKIPFSIENEPCNIRMSFASGNIENETSFFVGKNSVVVDFNIDSIYKRKVSGSLYEDEISAYQEYLMKNKLNVSDLQQKLISDNDKMTKTELNKTFHTIDSLESYNQTLVKNYIRNHPDNFVSVLALENIINELPKDTIIVLFKLLNSKYKSTFTGNFINEYISQPKTLDEGDKFIDFEAIDKNGKTQKLSDIKTKYILLEFTSVMCRGCIAAKKEIGELHQKYAKDVCIVSFYLDEDKKTWLTDLKESDIRWLSLWDGKGYLSSTYKKYGVRTEPAFFLINTNGIIVEKWDGYGFGLIEMKIWKYLI